MSSAVHNNKFRRGAVGEHLDFLLCIRNGVHDIFGSLECRNFNVSIDSIFQDEGGLKKAREILT